MTRCSRCDRPAGWLLLTPAATDVACTPHVDEARDALGTPTVVELVVHRPHLVLIPGGAS